MKKFYTHNGVEQEGPFDIIDLKAKVISKDTQIWHEGLPEWKAAEEIEELKPLFQSTTPPPFEPKKTNIPPSPTQEAKIKYNPNVKKGVSIWKAMQIFAGVIVFSIVGLFIYDKYAKANSGSGGPSSETYQEKVMTIEEIERASPAKFIKADGTYEENFWGTKMKVHGKVTNNATVVNYKDVVVEIIFYSETDTELSRARYTLYDRFPAHHTVPFEMKIDRPKACRKLGWSAVGAKPY